METTPEPTAEAKPKTVRDSEIAWGPDEPGAEGLTAIARGFELGVSPIEDKPGGWFWSVRATSAVSEVPELIGGAECATEVGAKRWARQYLNKTLRSWQGEGLGA